MPGRSVRFTRRARPTAGLPPLRSLRGSYPGLRNAASRVRRRPARTLYNRRTKGSFNPRRVLNIAPGVGGNTNYNKNWKISPKIKAMERVGALNAYSINKASRLDILSGFQDAQCFEIASVPTLLSMMSTVPSGGQPDAPKQYVLVSATAVFQIANNSLAAAHIDLYDILYKRDTTTQYVDLTGAAWGPLNALNAWRGGMHDQDQASSLTAFKQLMCKPNSSRNYRDYVNQKLAKHIMLAAGATHEHRVKLNYNRLVDSALLGANSPLTVTGTGIYALANFTHSLLINAYGTPASTGSDTLGSVVVSTAPLAIDIIQQVQYNYTWVSDTTNTWNSVDNLSSFATGTAQIAYPATNIGTVQIASP